MCESITALLTILSSNTLMAIITLSLSREVFSTIPFDSLLQREGDTQRRPGQSKSLMEKNSIWPPSVRALISEEKVGTPSDAPPPFRPSPSSHDPILSSILIIKYSSKSSLENTKIRSGDHFKSLTFSHLFLECMFSFWLHFRCRLFQ